MNKFQLTALVMIGLGANTMAASTYEQNINFIGQDVAGKIRELGKKSVDTTVPIKDIGITLGMLDSVIKTLSEGITGIGNKQDLITTVTLIKKSLEKIKNSTTKGQTAEEQYSLFTTKGSSTTKQVKFALSLIKTTADTNKAVKNLLQEWVQTLRNWKSEFDKNIEFINLTAVHQIEKLGQDPNKMELINNALYAVEQVINILRVKITGINNKDELIGAVSLIQRGLTKTKNALAGAEAFDIPAEYLDLEHIKFTPGGISKRTIDTNKAVKALVQAWRNALSKWSKKALSPQPKKALKGFSAK